MHSQGKSYCLHLTKEETKAQGGSHLAHGLPVSLSIPFILLECATLGSVGVRTHAPVHLEHLPRTLTLILGEGPPSLPNRASTLPPAAPRPCFLSPPSASFALFADAIGLQPDARGVATSLGLNERLFVVNPQEVHELVWTGRAPGPREDLCFGGGRDGC